MGVSVGVNGMSVVHKVYPPVQNEATKPEPMAGCGGVKSGQ